ncbi:alpha/beta hydrolase [Aspergillus fijiensis CBS 313.89]|uniref:Alpha/beta-hydrolase n=1 Tax=Aspergillus fijiensis CBS 313.89 TaxID=1448319 RepID=A0A8G1W162_9EURO|nr:alpha/beta-hydrolase [Aspergillus fijiensis CBS 313.89]RAK79338.1 alpha/beta-hydrolase [Aspergillus fijiensis CBS 313.89]
MKVAAALSLLPTLLYPLPATAQNMSYGANNFYRSDSVTLRPISFKNQYQMTVAANLFVPHNLTENGGAAPAIIVGHPMGAVKEQSANLYATKLAEQGFVTLSLDHQFWGGSSGEPRNAVSPDLYAEAFSAAVDYLGTQDLVSVDRQRIGAVGVCGSGSFLISAAKIDPRIRAIATASMYDMGSVNRNGLQHAQNLTQRQAIIADAAQHRWTELEDPSQTHYTSGTPNELTTDTSPVGREFYDFYRTSRGEFTPAGSTPELTTHPTLTSNLKFMNFYPFNDIESISPRPLLFISGDQAHSREFSEDAYARAAQPKELLWIPGAGHVDLYDRVDLIPFTRLTQFFQTNLASNDTVVARRGISSA